MVHAQSTLTLPSMESYVINPLFTFTLAVIPLVLLLSNSLSYKVRIVLLCFSLSLIQSFHRAGGDLSNYTIALNTSTIWDLEPFWLAFFY